jgi:hypothetical protein
VNETPNVAEIALRVADDYVKEMNMLLEVSSSMMEGLLGSFGRTKSAEQTRLSPAKVPMRAA